MGLIDRFFGFVKRVYSSSQSYPRIISVERIDRDEFKNNPDRCISDFYTWVESNNRLLRSYR